MKPRFAIIDCETTGFGALDRILEVAVVVLDGDSLETVDEFDTLVNPMRDVGRTDIHGIKPSMLVAAPSFEEVLAGVATRIDGAVLVGHNLPFDQRFIEQECARARTHFDAGGGICTYQLTRQKLAVAADRLGVPLDVHHRALVDARVTELCSSIAPLRRDRGARRQTSRDTSHAAKHPSTVCVEAVMRNTAT